MKKRDIGALFTGGSGGEFRFYYNMLQILGGLDPTSFEVLLLQKIDHALTTIRKIREMLANSRVPCCAVPVVVTMIWFWVAISLRMLCVSSVP